MNMTRCLLFTFVILVSGLPTMGCGDGENRTIETQGELWDERAAFYADENNFSDKEYVDSNEE